MRKPLIFLILFFVLSGCGFDSGEKVVEKNGDKITFAGKEGETLKFGTKELPTNFPKDIPVFPGAKPAGSYAASGENAGMIVGLESDGDFKKISDYYQTELLRNGWEVRNSTAGEETVLFKITKAERTGTVSVTKKDNKTEIAVMMGKVE